MYIFWYDYVKPKYVEKVKLFYMETDLVYRHSFIVYMRTEDIYANIAKFDISNYELGRPLPKGKNEKVIGLMKDELSGKTMAEFFDDMITDVLSNNKLNLIVTELFIRGKNAKHFSCFYYIILF